MSDIEKDYVWVLDKYNKKDKEWENIGAMASIIPEYAKKNWHSSPTCLSNDFGFLTLYFIMRNREDRWGKKHKYRLKKVTNDLYKNDFAKEYKFISYPKYSKALSWD
jgi:hypothetical protein